MSSTIRKYILITLTRANDRLHYTPHFIVSKCRGLFNCFAVIVSKEFHEKGGYHYHVGVLNDTASKNTATKKIREAFSDFEGKSLNVSFHKSWTTICTYLLKEDKNPFCWGTTKEECAERLYRSRKKKRSSDVISRLRACTKWSEVVNDDFLASKLLTSYSSIKQTWYDIHKEAPRQDLISRLKEYLEIVDVEGFVGPYTSNELLDRKKAMKWLFENVSKPRVLRQPQLIILGAPGVGKTEFLSKLSEFLITYDVPERKDDFSGASTTADIWVIDEFSNKRLSSSVLNKVLDGSKVSLDSKYGHVFVKDKNIPVILLTNEYPSMENPIQQKAFDTRVEATSFKEHVRLSAAGLARTLLNWLEPQGKIDIPSNERIKAERDFEE